MNRMCRIMINSWKPRFPELEHGSKMRVLKTHSQTSERRVNKADKVHQKEITKARPSPKGHESIVNESHRHATGNERGGEEDSFKSESE